MHDPPPVGNPLGVPRPTTIVALLMSAVLLGALCGLVWGSAELLGRQRPASVPTHGPVQVSPAAADR